MRFHEFLNRRGWSAGYRSQTLDAASAARQVSHVLGAITAATRPPHAGPPSLVLFVAFTPLEALVSFLAASHAGLLAAIVSPRSLPGFIMGLDPEADILSVVPDGRRLPEALLGVPTLRVAFAPPPAATWLEEDCPLPPASPKPARLVFCSSGTTGKPKRIVYDEERLVANAAVVADYLGLDSRDRSLSAFPVTYMYGLSTTLCALHSGSHIEYVDFSNARAMAGHAERLDITVLPVLGDWSDKLADEWTLRKYHSTDLRILNASDRITSVQARLLRPFAGALWNNFGQTESGPRLFALDLTRIEDFDRYEHDGIIAPGYPVHPEIVTRIGEPTTQGVGALLYRTPFAMSGMLRGDLSVEPAPEWIPSGDYFQCDRDGLHKWSGRTAHTIKLSGQLVSLRAIADGLLTVAGVTGVGYAKADDGTLFLFVEAAASDLPQQQGGTIRELIKLSLPGRAWRLRFLPQLPRTETGKINMRALFLAIEQETV